MIRLLLYGMLLAGGGGVFPSQLTGVRNLVDLVRERGTTLQELRQQVGTYEKDGRESIVDLYRAQCDLQQQSGWILEELFREEIRLAGGGRVALPANCLRTVQRGPALWILAGIHGEEPAGPSALSESLAVLVNLGRKGVPVVLLPLLNPLGYQRNWRYPDAAVYSENKPGSSVGDSDHLLPDEKLKPRSPGPACRQAGMLTAKVLALARDYPPLLALDLHEDNQLEKGYLYSQGRRGADDPVALETVKLLLGNKFPILTEGTTRFGEAVKKGIVSDVKDGSIDELLSAPTVIVNGSAEKGPGGHSVLVLETSSMGTGLAERKRVHARIIAALESLWEIAKADFAGG